MVFISMGQPPEYTDMSLAFFLNGYLAIVAEEGSAVKYTMLRHLQELFEDVEVYGWTVVREYHTAWLQLLEQGWAAWGDESKRVQLRRLIVWSKSSLSSQTPHDAGNPPVSFSKGKGEVWVCNPALQVRQQSLHWFQPWLLLRPCLSPIRPPHVFLLPQICTQAVHAF